MTSSRQEDEEFWKDSAIGKKKFNFDENAKAIDSDSIEVFGWSKYGAEKLNEALCNLTLDDFVEKKNSPFLSGIHEKEVKSARFNPEPGKSPLQNASPTKIRSESRSITAAEIAQAKLLSQIKSANKSNETTQYDRWAPLPIDVTINSIIFGKPYSLELYRSKEDKIKLLDSAIKFHDGNAILRAVFHLKHNTRPNIFFKVMEERPIAINHYINYLQDHKDYTELIDYLGSLGRTKEAAMIKYKLAINTSSPENKVKNLNNCLRTHFYNDLSLTNETTLIQGQLSLLQKQIGIEEIDAKAALSGENELFQQFPRQPLPFKSAMDTIFYLALYHYGDSQDKLTNPATFRKLINLNEKQYTYALVTALSETKQWLCLDSLLITKGMFGGTKLKTPIDIEKILDVFQNSGAPLDVFNRFIQQVDNTELKLTLAKKFQCHDLVINTLKQMKDKQQLIDYKNSLPSQSREYQLAQDVLRSSAVKWR